MSVESAFNTAVCVIGVALFLIHAVDLIMKRGKRPDEKNLLAFVLFTAVHFLTYLTYVWIKPFFLKSDPLTMGAYTTFYIMNNMEAELLLVYTLAYLSTKKKTRNIILAVNLAIFGIYVLLDIGNLFGNYFFTSKGGVYTRADMMLWSQGYQLVAFVFVFVLSIINKKVDTKEKIAFSLYCALPLLAIFLQNRFKGYAIAYLGIIISVEILFLFLNVKKNMTLAHQARLTKEAEVRTMMSQIRPHFVYNTLSSISALIKIDPEKAQLALDQFTEYLRTNFSAMTDTRLIAFADELKHIETYLALEKLRFAERLNVIYDIQSTEFLLPPLSVQPLVENAVKHGIMQNLEGGTVTIKSYETDSSFVVEILDDGVGFDLESVDQDGGSHVGLDNVRYRLSTMVPGELRIESAVGTGTQAKVIINK